MAERYVVKRYVARPEEATYFLWDALLETTIGEIYSGRDAGELCRILNANAGGIHVCGCHRQSFDEAERRGEDE